jgi:hypothetical protein
LFALLTSWYRPKELPDDVVAPTASVTRAPTAKPITALLMSIFVFINRDMRGPLTLSGVSVMPAPTSVEKAKARYGGHGEYTAVELNR